MTDTRNHNSGGPSIDRAFFELASPARQMELARRRMERRDTRSGMSVVSLLRTAGTTNRLQKRPNSAESRTA